MTERRLPHLIMPRRHGGSDGPLAERLMHTIGAHPAFVDALLGDLAEERARRTQENGAMLAGFWYTREALRAVPHLLWNAVRHGGASGRARVAAMLAALALLPVVVGALILRDAPPAALVFEGQRGTDVENSVVLNTTHPVQLVTRVLDAKQRELPPTTVRYEWAAGTPVMVTRNGVVTCTESGDAEVRASAGAVATTLLVRCRPVDRINGDMVLSLIAGGATEALPITAHAADGQRVDLMAWEARVEDNSIVALNGLQLRPLAPGSTSVVVSVGDGKTRIWVNVYEPVTTLAGLRPDQRLVSVPVQLGAGETIRWPLPTGTFWLRFTPATSSQPAPKIVVSGVMSCMPEIGSTDQASCNVREPGARIRISHPGGSGGPIVGRLALERRSDS